jgi:hypothetical protein
VNWSGKCKGPGGGDRRGALCTRVHTSEFYVRAFCNLQLTLMFFWFYNILSKHVEFSFVFLLTRSKRKLMNQCVYFKLRTITFLKSFCPKKQNHNFFEWNFLQLVIKNIIVVPIYHILCVWFFWQIWILKNV